MQNKTARRTVILATGGTIAGRAADPRDHVGYRAGQVGIEQLIAAVPALAGFELEAEQLAQIDSKDMDHALWQRLARCVAHHLARDEVGGIVITHGTDTLEETAYFLQRVLAPMKPVVLTGAMRPASALLADGPQNLLDAVTLARHAGARGVLAVLAGEVHAATDVRKRHPYRLDAFGSGDAGALGRIEEGRLRLLREWPDTPSFGIDTIARDAVHWPRVEIVVSHAGAGGALVRSLCADGVHGLVVAGTGNGSVHHALESALLEARQQGVRVLRCTRCAEGGVIDAPLSDASIPDRELASAARLTPYQARIELLLSILAAGD